MFFFHNHNYPWCYSEWMRTKNGNIVAVSCSASEQNNVSLYAYAYVHSILSFFRLHTTDEVDALSKNELSYLMIYNLRLAAQKLDTTLKHRVHHFIPSVCVYFTKSNDEITAFTIGNSAVMIIDEKKKKIVKQSAIIRAFMSKKIMNEKKCHRLIVNQYKTHSYQKIMFFPDINLEKNSFRSKNVFISTKNPEIHEKTFIRVFRALITGTRHVNQNEYCQDFADYRIMENNDIAVALSDGAGGGNYSEFGAIMNVNMFLSCCEDNIPNEKFKETLLYRIIDYHENLLLGKPDGAIQAYATLMGVYVKGDTIFCLHIGDGIIYGQKTDGTLECISDAENISSSSKTYFTIEYDSEKHFHEIQINKCDYKKILLISDGVYNGFSIEEKRFQNCGDQLISRCNTQLEVRENLIKRIFNKSDRECFDDLALAELIDTEEALAYGDDHSAILIHLE